LKCDTTCCPDLALCFGANQDFPNPTAVLAEMKRTEALLRDARSVLRRVDALAAKASTSDDPSRGLIAEVRTACEHLVSQLAHRQQIERRSAKQVARPACADAPVYVCTRHVVGHHGARPAPARDVATGA